MCIYYAARCKGRKGIRPVKNYGPADATSPGERAVKRVCVCMPPAMGRIKRCRDPSVICLSHLGQLGTQCLSQATRDVRTADPSAHRCRSAKVSGGILSHRAITCF